jgi:ribosomal protein S18 acetylase RimI-like enzyme
MNSRIPITWENSNDYFYLERLNASSSLDGFASPLTEYDEYLFQDALRSQDDHVALTWLLRENSGGNAAAYMALIMDAIKLSITEKERHSLKYPFKTIPAMKIAKLAVAKAFQERFHGIGSFMIYSAWTLARRCNQDYCACRFLTVDADIEHDNGVIAFYEKNGFLLNSELYNKNRKTVSMRKDLYG